MRGDAALPFMFLLTVKAYHTCDLETKTGDLLSAEGDLLRSVRLR